MSKEVERKHYSILTVVMLSICGTIFVALGIGVFVNIIISFVKTKAAFEAFVIVPILLFCVLPIALGSVALFLASKEAYHWIKENRTKKKGIETTAQIIDCKIVYHNGMRNKRYALVLSYEENGETKTFTTNYIFDINEYKYLKSLDRVKIKVNKNFVTVVEKFTKDIYKLDAKYGIELEFYKQKPVAKTLTVWRICCITALVLLVVSIVLTTTLKTGIYLIIGVCLLLAANLPFAIILAVYLIKWIWGDGRNQYKRNKYKIKKENKEKQEK